MIQATRATASQSTYHNIHPGDAQVLERVVTNHLKRLLLYVMALNFYIWIAPVSTRGNRSLALLAVDLKINKTTANTES